jgi:hypothetical protein
MKIYNQFKDKFNNQYSFACYADFSSFWFGLSRKAAQANFTNNFNDLQKAAYNSKEARTKI